MPEISTELLLFFALLETLRLKLDDPDKCRKHLVGRMRRLLGRPVPANVVPMATAFPTETQRAAQMALAGVCKMCGGCPMAEE